MTAIFVTATGTDIGKTFVAAGLIRHWRAQGRKAAALKPVMTGYDASTAAASDAGALLAAMGLEATEDTISQVSPWRFAAPLSPDMAAAREGRTLDCAELLEFCRRTIDRHDGTLLIEGIGGVMVPLDERHTVLDWIEALKIPALLVTGSYLGSLSHTLTSLDVLRRRSIAVAALAVNETPGSTVPLAETLATLRRFAGPTPVTALPRMDDGEAGHPAFAELATLL
ncbi:MAG: dethiobiotin synthase [Alphaproteobacteria bacterium]|nr:dethiobiotin synthase [Alphaproteobacteria bacterium]